MTPLVLLVGLTIALGLVVDRFGGVWGPPLAAGAFYCVLDLLSDKAAPVRRPATVG